jgi:hypothetical protein
LYRATTKWGAHLYRTKMDAPQLSADHPKLCGPA